MLKIAAELHLFLISALSMGTNVQLRAPAILQAGKEPPAPHDYAAGWAPKPFRNGAWNQA
jgi:hypothetical protein